MIQTQPKTAAQSLAAVTKAVPLIKSSAGLKEVLLAAKPFLSEPMPRLTGEGCGTWELRAQAAARNMGRLLELAGDEILREVVKRFAKQAL